MADLQTERLRVAVAAGDEVDPVEHFGRAARFLIYDVDASLVTFRESRFTAAACGGGEGRHDDRLRAVVDVIADCHFVLVREIGPGALRILQRRNITAIPVVGDVDDAVTTFAAAQERAARHQASGVSP
jgi:nitrogen fixation protein NifX